MIEPARALILAGPPGVGKSTVGQLLATERHGHAIDLDERVESRAGASPAGILRGPGEAALREAELGALLALDGALSDTDVLSLGGGTLTHAPSRSAARALGPVVRLTAPSEVLEARLSRDSTDRPLLTGGVGALLAAREPSYAACDAAVDASAEPPTVAASLRAAVGEPCVLQLPGSRILVARGLAPSATAGAVANLSPSRPCVLVIDAGAPGAGTVADAVSARFPSVRCVVPGGEPVKTWAQLGELLATAVAAGAGRQSVVLGIGGGAVCDLAGMVAGLLGRGCPLVLVPTTLLAQADASVGGKCAVDVGTGKNLIGLFHPAAEVVIDPALVSTQSDRDRRAGMAEVIKAGIVGDAELFHRIATAADVDDVSLVRAIAVKTRLVAADPLDRGVRRHLNLGHTLGHALEAASGFELRHGEAVAIGIAAAARVSVRRGLASRDTLSQVERTLRGVNLPTEAQASLLDAARPHLFDDKKGTSDRISLVLVHGIGTVSCLELSWKDAATELLRAGGRE